MACICHITSVSPVLCNWSRAKGPCSNVLVQRPRRPKAHRRTISGRSGGIIEIHVFAVKARRDIARLLAALQLALERPDDALLQLISAFGIDRMRNVRMQLQARMPVAILIALVAVFVEPP